MIAVGRHLTVEWTERRRRGRTTGFSAEIDLGGGDRIALDAPRLGELQEIVDAAVPAALLARASLAGHSARSAS